MNPAKNSGTGFLLRINILDAFSSFPDEKEKGQLRLQGGLRDVAFFRKVTSTKNPVNHGDPVQKGSWPMAPFRGLPHTTSSTGGVDFKIPLYDDGLQIFLNRLLGVLETGIEVSVLQRQSGVFSDTSWQGDDSFHQNPEIRQYPGHEDRLKSGMIQTSLGETGEKTTTRGFQSRTCPVGPAPIKGPVFPGPDRSTGRPRPPSPH